MATLQKIRNHGFILMVIVGLAMLAFILGDFLNSGSTIFNSGREDIGEVAGHSIHYTEYEGAREQLIEVYKIETGQTSFDDDFYSQINNQVWQSKVLEYSLSDQARKIGMEVTADELSQLCIGVNPHPYISSRRAFFDENGRFSRDNLVRFLASLNQGTDDPEQAGNLKQAENYWMYWENAVKMTHLQDKYMNLVSELNKVNSLEAKYNTIAKQTLANMQYVFKPFYEIPDSAVVVPQSEINKLYKLRKRLYKQTPNRYIEYVTFPIRPSQDDFDKVRDQITSLIDSFVHTKEVANVVNIYSDIPFDKRDYSKEMIPERYREFAFAKNAKKDDTTSLVLDGDTYTMARIIKCGYSMPDSVKLKLIAAEDGKEDSELGWFTPFQLNTNISEPAFKGKKGERFSVKQGNVEQTFEILDISVPTPKVQLAILERRVTPSSKTNSIIYNQAKQFIVQNNTEESFRQVAKDNKLNLMSQRNILKTSDKIGNLSSSRRIVKWAFEAKEGQVSDIFECGDVFVAAVLVEANDNEYMSLEQVKSELNYEVLNQQKYASVAKDVKDLKSLNEVAAKLGKEVQSVEGLQLEDGRIGNVGYEPAVSGTLLAMQAGTVSKPVNGKNGVFVLQLLDRQSPSNIDENTIKQEKEMMKSRYNYTLNYKIISLIQDKTEIKDNRFNFQ